MDNPRRRQFLTHARRLNLMAIPDVRQQGYDDYRWSNIEVRRPDERLRPRDLVPHTFDSPGFFFDRYLMQLLVPSHDGPLVWQGFYKERNWEPLVSLISSMVHLTEIHYMLLNMFPKCLLDVIHEYHITCHLSVWGWQRLSLHKAGFEGMTSNSFPQYEDPFEIELLRSPCLHAVSFLYAERTLRPGEYLAECIFPLLTMAPNLKHIYLRHSWSYRSDNKLDLSTSNQRWGEFIASMNPRFTAAPVSLNLQMTHLCALAEWSKSTDFTSVQALEFPRFSYPLEVTMSQLSKFTKLEYLKLSLEGPFGGRVPDFEDNLKAMLANLIPLKYLHVICPRDTSIIHEIFSHHGTALRGFIIECSLPGGSDLESLHPLYPVFSDDDLINLARKAPYLEELRLPIRRCQGDRTEYQMYKALGKFSALRSLILDLDCNPRDSVARDYNQFTEQSPKLPIADVFKNAAMDEELAWAIWGVIDSGGGERLRNLRISIFGSESLPRADSEVIRRYLSRSFLISRSMSCTGAHVKLSEIGKEEKELQAARQREYDDNKVLKMPKRVQKIIKSIWPSESEKVNWKFKWKSFPLQVDNTVSG